MQIQFKILSLSIFLIQLFGIRVHSQPYNGRRIYNEGGLDRNYRYGSAPSDPYENYRPLRNRRRPEIGDSEDEQTDRKRLESIRRIEAAKRKLDQEVKRHHETYMERYPADKMKKKPRQFYDNSEDDELLRSSQGNVPENLKGSDIDSKLQYFPLSNGTEKSYQLNDKTLEMATKLMGAFLHKQDRKGYEKSMQRREEIFRRFVNKVAKTMKKIDHLKKEIAKIPDEEIDVFKNLKDKKNKNTKNSDQKDENSKNDNQNKDQPKNESQSNDEPKIAVEQKAQTDTLKSTTIPP